MDGRLPGSVRLCLLNCSVFVLLSSAASQDIIFGGGEASHRPAFAQFSSCTSDNGQAGTCRIIQQCPPLLDLVRRKPSGYISQLRKATISCGGPPRICCIEKTSALGDKRPGKPFIATIPTRQPIAAPTISHLLGKPFESPRDCGESFFSPNRVVGGKPVLSQTWFPWMVALSYQTSSRNRQVYRCAGAVINKSWVLTAAHCITVDGPTAARVRELNLATTTDDFEANPPVDVPVERIVRHPEFTRQGRVPLNDIALLKLRTDLVFSDILKPICIKNRRRSESELEAIEVVHIAGWGKTSFDAALPSSEMMWAAIDVTNFTECVDKYKSARTSINPSIQMCAAGDEDPEFCAEFPEACGGVDSCRGDSGGPLMHLIKVGGTFRVDAIGIVSFGIGCGNPDLPGVYTRLDSFINWIGDVVNRS